jgi:hypothetical protein
MGRSKKFDYPAIIENELTAQPAGLSLDELLARCGLKVDRSTLFRHLARLIEKGYVERIGNARASRYRTLRVAGIGSDSALSYTQRPRVQSVPEFHSQVPNETPILSPGEGRESHQAAGAEPDPLPVAAPDYDTVVKKAVRTVVREWKRCNHVNLQIYLSLLVKPEHLNDVAAVVEKELAGLHGGNLAGFGLSQDDFSGFIPPAGRESTG